MTTVVGLKNRCDHIKRWMFPPSNKDVWQSTLCQQDQELFLYAIWTMMMTKYKVTDEGHWPGHHLTASPRRRKRSFTHKRQGDIDTAAPLMDEWMTADEWMMNGWWRMNGGWMDGLKDGRMRQEIQLKANYSTSSNHPLITWLQGEELPVWGWVWLTVGAIPLAVLFCWSSHVTSAWW